MPEYLTKKALEELKKKIEQLKKVKRPEIAERINAAKELGDLSENAEYVSAKEEQGLLESEIIRLENILRMAVVVSGEKNRKVIAPGACVTIEIEKEKRTLCLVDSDRVSPSQGKISIQSPLGKALLNKKQGETGVLEIPAGKKKFKIISIEWKE